jgi:hypothetical protein
VACMQRRGWDAQCMIGLSMLKIPPAPSISYDSSASRPCSTRMLAVLADMDQSVQCLGT